jgi:hypothetical protein
VRERPASQTYIASSLKLRDVAMKMSEDRVPGIFGTITNDGKRALDQVALAVTWYEGRGKSLRQVFREQHAIVITPLQFTDFSRPVVPFLPGATRQFGFILTAPGEVQQNGSPYVTVDAIVFTASAAPLPQPVAVKPTPLPHAHLTPASTPASPSAARTPSGPPPGIAPMRSKAAGSASKPSARSTPSTPARPVAGHHTHAAVQP